MFHQKQKTMQKTLEYEQTILKEREVRMRQIEEDVLDVNQIMNELNQIVHEQGENIGELKIGFCFPFKFNHNDMLLRNITETIAEGIEQSANDVESGQSQLQKAAEYQAKYRRKVAILLIIAVIIGLIVTGAVVSSLRS